MSSSENMPLNLSLSTFLAGGTAIASGAMGGLGHIASIGGRVGAGVAEGGSGVGVGQSGSPI